LGRRRPLPFLAMAVAGAGWLLIVLVVLPLAGAGLLGLGEGITTPIVYALLFVVFAVVMQAVWPAGAAQAVDEGRRRFLGLVPLGFAAGGLAVLGFRLVPEWYRAVATPPESGLVGPSPELTPVENFYVASKNFSDPVVSARGWALSVQGLGAQPYRLS